MLEKKRSLLLFYAIAALQGMVFYASIATLYRQAVGVTLLQITMIESVSLVLSVALEVPWGAAADRLGYRKTLMVCAFLFFASKVVFWQAAGVGGFLLERILLAVTLSGLSGCDSAYLYLCAGERGSHKAYSRWELASAAGMLVASGVFTLFLGTRYRLAALLTVLAYGAAAVLSLGLGEVPSPPKMTARAHLTDIRSALGRSLPLLPVLLAATFLRETGQLVTVFFSPLVYLRGGIPIPLFGLLHGGVTLCGMAGAALSYRYVKRVGLRPGGGILLLGGGVICVLLAVTRGPISVVLGMLLLRFCASAFAPLSLLVQNRAVTSANRATVLSLYAVVMDLTSAAMSPVLGALADLDVSYALLLCALLCFAGGIAFLLSKAQPIGAQAPQPEVNKKNPADDCQNW
ncbi:MAG: MFS transporter [Oscillospiraceae bacterium]